MGNVGGALSPEVVPRFEKWNAIPGSSTLKEDSKKYYLISLCTQSGQFSGKSTTRDPRQMMITPANFIPENDVSYQ